MVFFITKNSYPYSIVKGVPPSPRAAHSSTNVEQMQMVVYGGATGGNLLYIKCDCKTFYIGGSLASDDLYLLDMRNGEEMAQWMIVPVVGSTPGRRYGHTIIFSKPHLLVFGGNTGQESVNDVWCLSVEKAPFSWIRLDCGKENPAVRVYHSSALC
jgi:protein phosphatase